MTYTISIKLETPSDFIEIVSKRLGWDSSNAIDQENYIKTAIVNYINNSYVADISERKTILAQEQTRQEVETVKNSVIIIEDK